MATYTFKLLDFGLAPLTTLVPRVVFTADSPAFSGENAHVTRRVEATLATDGSGSVELVPSVNTTPHVTYTMRIEWLDPNAFGPNHGYIGMDVIGGLVAALGGGRVSDMTGIPITRFWAGPADPNNPTMPLGITPEAGLWWLNTVTGDLKEWI